MVNGRNHHAAAGAAVSAVYLAYVADVRKAVHYACAADRDERSNFPLTAAWEWRKAAELFGPYTSAAEYCWRQWERIVQLSRHLAAPICDQEGNRHRMSLTSEFPLNKMLLPFKSDLLEQRSELMRTIRRTHKEYVHSLNTGHAHPRGECR